LHTGNGGQGWTSRNSGIAFGLNGLYFRDENTGWTVGSNGTVYATANGGQNWALQTTPVLNDLNDIFFVNPGRGWAIGNGGVILSRGPLTGIADDGLSPAVSYGLGQNYPNPFNPSTTISFRIPQAQQVQLTVYNLLGQEIAVLKNETMPAGEHHLVFDAQQLTTGIYFYELQAGDYRELRRMVLMR
ncbi:MAG: T9SS type A sorting domain-containing protein, partial [Calditrichaeota bacterium]|nr:T9SS type A sorting domain-containing protein [Calditrichota bacterium]